jgi:hypothetical protein
MRSSGLTLGGQIGVPEASSIDYQNRKWANMTVNYQMGLVDFSVAPNVQ